MGDREKESEREEEERVRNRQIMQSLEQTTATSHDNGYRMVPVHA